MSSRAAKRGHSERRGHRQSDELHHSFRCEESRNRQRHVRDDTDPHHSPEPHLCTHKDPFPGCRLLVQPGQNVFMYSTIARLSASDSFVPYTCPPFPLPGSVVSNRVKNMPSAEGTFEMKPTFTRSNTS